MRQVMAYVKEGQGKKALAIADSMGGSNLITFKVTGIEEADEIVVIHASNDKLDKLIEKLEETFSDIRLSFFPQGVIALKPPQNKSHEQVTDVTFRSPIEIFLSGLQSIGSWKGFLGYAAFASIVVWIGLYTNTVYLLVAAMLIAPFAGPAMTLAMGTARGDKKLILDSCLRYFASILVCILTAAILSALLGQEIATELMTSTSSVSSITTLLALTAGAAGALALCQSDRSSLVTATGPGMLVAASLAPPAGIIGMASTIGEWGMVQNGVFLIVTQLIGINISGASVFYLFGVRPSGVRYDRGKQRLSILSLTASLFFFGAILYWQFSSSPNLQRSSQERRVAAVIKKYINNSSLAKPVEVNVRFTRADIENQNTLLVTTFVQKKSGLDLEEVKGKLTSEIKKHILENDFNVTPLIDVTVLE